MLTIRIVLFSIISLIIVLASKGNKPVYTQVTALYDINRGILNSGFRRPFQYYLDYFEQLLKIESNLIIFGDKELGKFVWQRRKEHNTVFVERQLSTFRSSWYYPFIQNIRKKFLNDPNFQQRDYPQYALQGYNAIVMSKLFLLKQALNYDKFNSDYFIWTDAGYIHQYNENIVYPQNLIQKFYQFVQPQWIFLDYEAVLFDYGYAAGSQRYINKSIPKNELILAANFGGYVQVVQDITNTYQNMLRITFEYGDMNVQENVLSMMPFKYPYLVANTIYLKYNELKQKMHLYQSVNRKRQYHRNFRITAQDFLQYQQQINVSIIIPKVQHHDHDDMQIYTNLNIEEYEQYQTNQSSIPTTYKIAFYRLLFQFAILLLVYIYLIFANVAAKKQQINFQKESLTQEINKSSVNICK